MRAFVLSLLMLNVATPVAAKDAAPTSEEPRIRWGAVACDSGPALLPRVRALLPEDSPIPEAFEAGAEVTAEGGAYRLRVDLPDGVQREFVSQRCQPLAEVAALVIAVAIDPGALSAPRVDVAPPGEREVRGARDLAEQLTAPERRAAPEQPDLPRTVEPAPSSEAPVWTVGVEAAIGLGVGVLPEPLPGPVLDAMVAYDAVVLRLGFGYLPSSAAAYDETRGATLDLLAGRMSVCGRWVLTPFTGELCADGEAGVIRAAGYGLDRPRATDVPFASLGPSVRARVAVAGPLGLHASVGASFFVDPPTFVIDGAGDVFTPEPVSLRALLGLDVAWDFGGPPEQPPREGDGESEIP